MTELIPGVSPTVLLCGLFFAAALLYSSVGHAGASGYIAAMALLGMAPEAMRPTALTLNIIVATLATWRLWRAGLVSIPTLVPLVLASIPLAFWGGTIQLPGHVYRPLVGLVLLVAAAKFLLQPKDESRPEAAHAAAPPLWAALLTGAAIGLLSGLTGTGGGIFLSPLLLLFGWANARRSAGLAAPFILLNSIAGLAGSFAKSHALPPELPWFALAVLAGALIGTQLSIKLFSPQVLQRVLGVVLLVAAGKFLLG